MTQYKFHFSFNYRYPNHFAYGLCDFHVSLCDFSCCFIYQVWISTTAECWVINKVKLIYKVKIASWIIFSTTKNGALHQPLSNSNRIVNAEQARYLCIIYFHRRLILRHHDMFHSPVIKWIIPHNRSSTGLSTI